MSEDYQVQNVYRYARKSYKNGRSEARENCGLDCQNEVDIESDHSPRAPAELPGCSCPDREDDVASILHKKCPVISLAQQQLQRVLDETDKLLYDNNRCCRSVYDFLYLCRELCMSQNKCTCALIILIAIAFSFGLLFGAASCGTYLGRFNSPLLTCLDNLFISEKYTDMEAYRGIT